MSGRKRTTSSEPAYLWTQEGRDKYVADLVNQIARDIWTLNHDEATEPGADFYQQRVIDYQAEVERVRGMA